MSSFEIWLKKFVADNKLPASAVPKLLEAADKKPSIDSAYVSKKAASVKTGQQVPVPEKRPLEDGYLAQSSVAPLQRPVPSTSADAHRTEPDVAFPIVQRMMPAHPEQPATAFAPPSTAVSGADIKAYFSQFSPAELGMIIQIMRVKYMYDNRSDPELLLRYYKENHRSPIVQVKRILASDYLHLQRAQRMQPEVPRRQTVEPTRVVVPVEEAEEQDSFEDAATESTFHEYAPMKYRGGTPHPDPLVESSSLSAVDPPDVTFQLSLPDKLVGGGTLSSAQLEGITYACQAHEELLANGERKGYFIGDGAGVGKGRQLAGILLENQLRGCKKHVWLSVSADLRVDAKRDLEDIGAAHLKTFNLADFDYSPIRLASGIIFTTYSSLISARKTGSGKKSSRLDQLLAWCGSDFCGCLLFDECHKAKNLGVQTKQSSKTGLAVYELQEKLPKARIVYCSATGITTPGDMAYMTRLGLWGTGTSFPLGFREYLGTIERGGLGMMELVAMHLKRSGVYHCRALSFKGTEFEIVENDASDAEVGMYNMAADLWQLMFFEVIRVKRRLLQPPKEGDIGRTDKQISEDKQAVKKMMTYFWGAHQRFFRSLCISLKVKRAIEMTKHHLAEGKSVIIGLQGTGEASVNEAVQKNEGLDDFISAPKRTLLNTIDKIFGLNGVVRKQEMKISKVYGKMPFQHRDRFVESSSESSITSDNDLSDFIASSEESVEEDSGNDTDEIVECRHTALGKIRRAAPSPRVLSKKMYVALVDEDDGIWSEDSASEPALGRSVTKISTTEVRDLDESCSEDSESHQLRTPSDSPTKASLNAKAVRKMKSEGWCFAHDEGADSWVSKRCRKFYDGKPFDGTIIAFLPASENEGLPIWHLKHDDGDSEDLDEEEVKKYSALFQENVSRPPEDSYPSDSESTQTEGSPSRQGNHSDSALNNLFSLTGSIAVEKNVGPDHLGIDAMKPGYPMIESAMSSLGWIFADDHSLPAHLKKELFGEHPDRLACLPGSAYRGRTLWITADVDGDPRRGSDFLGLSSDLSLYYSSKGINLNIASSSGTSNDPVAHNLQISSSPLLSHKTASENSDVGHGIGSSRKRPFVLESETDSDCEDDSRRPVSAKMVRRIENAHRETPEGRPQHTSVATMEIDRGDDDGIFLSPLSADAISLHNNIYTKLASETVESLNLPLELGLSERAAAESRYRLFRSLADNISPPGNPLDSLLDKLGGVQAVAEMTGRKGRMLRDKKTGKVFYHRRTENGQKIELQNIHERELFQKGKKRVAIISEAASAGISLQADRRKDNQDRRVHITLELPWSADRAIQQLGRSHRSNQTSPPEYKILVTRFGGENRFASAVAKKMISLGAMTHGDRRSTVDTKHINLAHFDYDSKYGKKALDEMMIKFRNKEASSSFPELSEALERETVLQIDQLADLQAYFFSIYGAEAREAGSFKAYLQKRSRGSSLRFSEASLAWLYLVGVDVVTGVDITVAKFFNRILGLQFERQNILFQVFNTHLEDIVRAAKRNGNFDLGILEIRGHRPEAIAEANPPKKIYENPISRDLTLLHEIQHDKGILWEESEQILRSSLDEFQNIKGPLEVRVDETSGAPSYFKYTSKKKETKCVFGYYLAKDGFGTVRHCVLAHEKISFVQDYLPTKVMIFRPRTGRHEMERASLYAKYRLISAAEAKNKWNDLLHDDRVGGQRLIKMKIISGSVLPIWPVVEMFLKKIFDPYTGTEKKSRICIVRASIHSSVGNSIPTSENRSSENSGVNTRSLIGVLIAGDKTESMILGAIQDYIFKQEAAAAMQREQQRISEAGFSNRATISGDSTPKSLADLLTISAMQRK